MALFEIGPAFAVDAAEDQTLVAAGLRAGTTPRNWLAPARPVDAMDAKADLWAVLTAVGVPLDALVLTQDALGLLSSRPLRPPCARDRRPCWEASANCIHACWRRWISPDPMVAFELDLDAVGRSEAPAQGAPDLPPFQPIRRDFAFLVDSAVTADAVLRAARGAERALITGVSLFDLYQGDTPAGRQEVAGDRGGVPAARADADRCRDRGRQSEGGCGGGEGDGRHAALMAGRARPERPARRRHAKLHTQRFDGRAVRLTRDLQLVLRLERLQSGRVLGPMWPSTWR